MTDRARIEKKKAAKQAKKKAAESGVSTAQKTFAKFLEKSDPKPSR